MLMPAFWFLKSVTCDSSSQVMSQTKSKKGIQLNCTGSESNPAENCVISGMHRHSTPANSNCFWQELLNGTLFCSFLLRKK